MVQQGFTPSIAEATGSTPLRRFRGKLQGTGMREHTFEGRDKPTRYIQFAFTDLLVMETDSPYPYPIGTIEVTYTDPASSRGQTKWEALAASIRLLLPPGTPLVLDEVLVGKDQEWALLPAKLRVQVEGKWQTAEDEAWQVVSLQGAAAATDITPHVLDLLDGQTDAGFHEALYADALVKSHPKVVEAVTNRTLLTSLSEAGKCWRDDGGVWHKGPKL